MTTAHTASTLLALHRDDPRKLDALAHYVIFEEEVTIKSIPSIWVGVDEETKLYHLPSTHLMPHYTASLDAAAMLEARLAERDMEGNYGAALMDVLDKEFHPSIFYIATATARDRTIAAVLAAQEAK